MELEPNMSFYFHPYGKKTKIISAGMEPIRCWTYFPSSQKYQPTRYPGRSKQICTTPKKLKTFDTPPKISANHPEAAKNQSQAATKKHLRGDIGCEDEHFRIKSLYFNDIQYHLPFSTKQRTGFWDDGLQGLEKSKQASCFGGLLGGEILGGLQVTLAKGLHPGQSTCWIQGHGALLKMILLLQRQWFLGCLACSGVNFPGFRLHPNGLFSHRTLPWRNQVS